MGNLHFSVDESDLVDALYFRRQTAMNAENLAINQRSDWEMVKYVYTVGPGIRISVLDVDLFIKTVREGDLPGFMVASQKSYMGGELQLEQKQEFNSLNRVMASVHKIADEDVVGSWRLSPILSNLSKS